jgi:hypothetical protein
MEAHSDGSVTLTATEATELREIFDYILTGRRLEAGFSSESHDRYARFVSLRRELLNFSRPIL